MVFTSLMSTSRLWRECLVIPAPWTNTLLWVLSRTSSCQCLGTPSCWYMKPLVSCSMCRKNIIELFPSRKYPSHCPNQKWKVHTSCYEKLQKNIDFRGIPIFLHNFMGTFYAHYPYILSVDLASKMKDSFVTENKLVLKVVVFRGFLRVSKKNVFLLTK